jgi:two-component system phosphate regulon sensor histidine kinase PhoR
MERIDFHDLIQQVLETMRLQMEARQTQLVLHLNAHPAHLMADRVHLGNVVQNLFDNALKYTEGQPHLTLDTYTEDNLLALSVKDNGIGISRENQRRVFDNLFRVPTGNVHNVKGFGLGLSYVKAIVEKHGGRVALESELGKGSTFKIYLPFEGPEAFSASA